MAINTHSVSPSKNPYAAGPLLPGKQRASYDPNPVTNPAAAGPVLPGQTPSWSEQQVNLPAAQQIGVPSAPDFGSLLSQFSVNAPGATPTPALQSMPTNTNYDDEAFMQSVEASRGDVARQVQHALGEIERQKGANLAQVAQIPGRLEGIFDPAAQAVQQQNEGLANAQSAAGLQSFMPADVLAQPTLAALAQQQAIFGGTVPLLESGFNELAMRQTGGARNLGMTLNEQLSSEGRGYVADRGAEDRGYVHDTNLQTSDHAFRAGESAADRAFRGELFAQEQAGAQSRFNAEQAQRAQQFNAQQRSEAESRAFQADQAQRDRDFQAQQTTQQQAFETQQAEGTAPKLSDFSPREINPNMGGVLEPDLVNKIRGDKRWDDDLQKTADLVGEYGSDPATLITKLREYFKHRTRTASLALSDLGYFPE